MEKKGLEIAEKHGVFAIKPNYNEFCEYIGIEPDSLNEIAAAAMKKAESISNVIVSLGEEGAVFATRTEAYHAVAKDVSCLSTTGAGDALLSGFIYGAFSGKSYKDSVKWAVATASAKVGEEGTRPPEFENIEKFLNNVTVTQIR